MWQILQNAWPFPLKWSLGDGISFKEVWFDVCCCPGGNRWLLESYRASTHTVSETGCDHKKRKKKVWNLVWHLEKYRRTVIPGGQRERTTKTRSLPGRWRTHRPSSDQGEIFIWGPVTVWRPLKFYCIQLILKFWALVWGGHSKTLYIK